MFLDNHIENRVKDEVLIFKILFHKKSVHLTELINITNFSKIKITTIIKELQELFSNHVSISENPSHIYSLRSFSNLSFRELQHVIFQQSNILNALKYLITNKNKNLNDFIDSVYISKASAYRVIDTCKSFLKHVDLTVKNYQIQGEEFRIRYLIASLSFNYGIHCYKIFPQDFYRARKFICQTNPLIDFNFLKSAEEEYGFFEYLIILSWIRPQLHRPLPKNIEFDELKQLFIYKSLPTYLDDLFEEISWSQYDLDYIFLAYCSTKNPLFSNGWSEKDTWQFLNIIYNQKRVIYLLELMEEYLGPDIVQSNDFKTGIFYLYKRYLFNLYPLIKINNHDCEIINSTLDTEIKRRLILIKSRFEQQFNISEIISPSELNYFTILLSNLLRSIIPTVTLTIVSESITDHKLMKHLLYNHLPYNKFVINEFLLGAEPIDKLKGKENHILIFTKSFNFSKILDKETVITIPLNCIDMSFSSLVSLLKTQEERNVLSLINKRG